MKCKIFHCTTLYFYKYNIIWLRFHCICCAGILERVQQHPRCTRTQQPLQLPSHALSVQTHMVSNHNVLMQFTAITPVTCKSTTSGGVTIYPNNIVHMNSVLHKFTKFIICFYVSYFSNHVQFYKNWLPLSPFYEYIISGRRNIMHREATGGSKYQNKTL